MRAACSAPMPHWPVSIRTPRCRGAMRHGWHKRRYQHVVSIRTPRCRGAMPFLYGSLTRPDMFQSAPLVAEGRCRASSTYRRASFLFQSAPLVAEGRCKRSPAHRCIATQFQSAPLVAEGRCANLIHSAKTSSTFQSAPLVAEGRCSSSLTRGRNEQKMLRSANVTTTNTINLHPNGCSLEMFHRNNGVACARTSRHIART